MARGNIEKRGKNAYRIRVYLGKGADGRKKYHRETVRGTKKQAQQRLTEILRGLDTGGFVERNTMVLEEYLNYWLDTAVRPYRAAKTVETYEQAVGRICKRKGNIPLQSLTPLDCQEYYSWALTRGRGKDKNGRWLGYSESSVSIDHRTLHKALEDAVAWGLLARNVAAVVPHKPKTQHRTRDVWSEDEAAQFLQYMQGHRLYAYFVLALTSGLRRAELCGLKRSSLRLEDHEIDIEHTLVEVSDGEGGRQLILQEYQAKTDESLAPITISPAVVAILKKHLARQAEEKLALGPRYKDEGYVFCQIDGRPLSPKNMTKLFPKLCERAGVPVIRHHDTRHTFITKLLLDKLPPQVVMHKARHTRYTTTVGMYGHLTKRAEAAYTDAMDDILPGQRKSKLTSSAPAKSADAQ